MMIPKDTTIPCLSLESPRLILAGAGCIEAESVLQFYVSNRAFHAPWDPVRPESFFTLEGVVEMLGMQQNSAHSGTGFAWYLEERGSDVVCGYIGVSNIVRGPFLSCFLGYKIAADHVGRDLMTEALGAVVPWLFGSQALHRIEANVMPRNGASIRVLEKLGFVCEGRSERYLKIAGTWEAHLHYALLNDTMQ